MKNLQQGFIGLVIAIIVGLVLIGGGTYVYLNKDKSSTPANTEQENSTETSNSTVVSPPSGLLSYSNKVFSNFFPKGWMTREVLSSSSGCSAQVYFVQNSVPKQTLINESTDYLHYLSNPGSVISVSGGVGEQGTVSFENLKKALVIWKKMEGLSSFHSSMKML